MSAASEDLLRLQRDAVVRMLNLNEEQSDSSVWKVLVFDRFAQDLLAPLLNVGELRKLGITLHLLIDKPRDRVADVPAVYFVSPTEENINRISSDIQRNIYDSFYLNFTSSVSKNLLEKLAQSTVQNDCANRIAKIFDQHCQFVSLESKLFSFNLPNSFSLIHSARTPESQLESFVNQTVDSLFSVFVTMSAVPIIRCPPGSAAAMIASQLDERLRQHLTLKNNLFLKQDALSGLSPVASSIQRPLLVLTDRTVDMSVALHHAWTYQALLHDLLGMKANRIKMNDSAKDGKSASAMKVFDLDKSDEFFARLAGLPISQIAGVVDQALQEYQNDMAELNRKTGMDFSSSDASQLSAQSATAAAGLGGLASAIDMVPKLQEKKKRIDIHVNLASALMKQLKARELDEFFELEEALLTRGHQDKSAILRFLNKELPPSPEEQKDVSCGTPEDKLRLLLMSFLVSGGQLSSADLDECCAALSKFGVDLSSLNFLKKHQSVSSFTSASASSQSSAASVARGLFDNLLDRGAGLLSGVKNILPVSKDLTLTKIVDALMENKANSEAEAYLYFDPKTRSSGGKNRPKQLPSFREAIVFVVGGGNYIEFQNLQENATSSSNNSSGIGKSIVYGCTELISPTDFLSQLTSLGREITQPLSSKK